MVAACAADRGVDSAPSPHCKSFLDANDKARVQWKLEQNFAAFEKKF